MLFPLRWSMPVRHRPSVKEPPCCSTAPLTNATSLITRIGWDRAPCRATIVEPFCHQCAAGGPPPTPSISSITTVVWMTRPWKSVNESPWHSSSGTLDVCRYDTVAIDVIPIAGVAPLTVQWTPSNVENDTLFSTFPTWEPADRALRGVGRRDRLSIRIPVPADQHQSRSRRSTRPPANLCATGRCCRTPSPSGPFAWLHLFLVAFARKGLADHRRDVIRLFVDHRDLPPRCSFLQFYRRYRRQHHRLPGHGQHHLLDRSRIERQACRFPVRSAKAQPTSVPAGQLVCLDCKAPLYTFLDSTSAIFPHHRPSQRYSPLPGLPGTCNWCYRIPWSFFRSRSPLPRSSPISAAVAPSSPERVPAAPSV